MERRNVFSNWTQTAALFLIGGALSWTMKLLVIIATNGRIIDTGAAALLMKTGMLLLLVGSTSFGSGITANRNRFLRAGAILLSPLVVFGTCFLLTTALNPLVEGSGVWYAAQELPIAVVVLVCFPLGLLLLRRYQPAVM